MRQIATTFKIPAAALVQAVKARVFEVGGSSKGEYNRQDPTAYEKGFCYAYFEMDQYLLKNYRYTPTEEDLKEYPKEMFDYAPPPDALYRVDVIDVTWGTEIKVRFIDSSLSDAELEKYLGSNDGAEVLSFYLDHQDGCICWEKDLDKVRDFMLFMLCGDAQLSAKRKVFEKDMSEDEVAAAEAAREADAMLRNCI